MDDRHQHPHVQYSRYSVLYWLNCEAYSLDMRLLTRYNRADDETAQRRTGDSLLLRIRRFYCMMYHRDGHNVTEIHCCWRLFADFHCFWRLFTEFHCFWRLFTEIHCCWRLFTDLIDDWNKLPVATTTSSSKSSKVSNLSPLIDNAMLCCA